jgi:hypothetical protein
MASTVLVSSTRAGEVGDAKVAIPLGSSPIGFAFVALL